MSVITVSNLQIKLCLKVNFKTNISYGIMLQLITSNNKKNTTFSIFQGFEFKRTDTTQKAYHNSMLLSICSEGGIRTHDQLVTLIQMFP